MISCKEYVGIRKKILKDKIARLKENPCLPVPCLAVIQVGDDPASNSYIKGKIKDGEELGICVKHATYDSKISSEELQEVVRGVCNNPYIHGVIVQLPLPEHCNIDLRACMNPKKDVDGFLPESPFDPCTPKGIIDWLEYNEFDFPSKDVTVLGRSKIVGKPLVNMLIDRGATVTCCNSKTDIPKLYTSISDLVISAVGTPKKFDYSYFLADTIVVDVGINRDQSGKLCGDVDVEDIREIFNEEEIYVTPVPGGVGLLTRLALMENVFQAYLKQEGINDEDLSHERK